MAQSARQTLQHEVPDRPRRDDLIRPPELRRNFPIREAQRNLQQKERPWAPLAYAVFLVAAIFIFSSAYSAYAFSRYKDVILPGVSIDNLPVGGMTKQQATLAIYARLAAIYHEPVRIVYNAYDWNPRDKDIGLNYQVPETVQEAQSVGRTGGFIRDLIDRLPIHPSHQLPMLYTLDNKVLGAYLLSKARQSVDKPATNAGLTVTPDKHVALLPSHRGLQIDLPASERAINDALGYLTRQTVTLRVNHVNPVIPDEAAIQVRDRVERFLQRPPILKVGKLSILTSRADLAPMLSFKQVTTRRGAAIQMNVNSTAVQAYIAKLAGTIDRPALNAKLDFSGGRVTVISPRRNGRTLEQQTAYQSLLSTITALKPNARLVFTVTIAPPPVDLSNPASVGIDTLLASGQTSFQGAGPQRLNDIEQIAKQLDGDLLPPKEDISFNTLTGTDWDPSVYTDQETASGGEVVPGPGGAMQQVATTFLRALYQAGLPLKERHAHTHRLRWYEPPVGYDALVAPDRNWDLVFGNDTNKYLLIKTRVEPVRQELYIYVYGPKLGRSVAVDRIGKISKVLKHGPKVIKEDPSLPPGQVLQTQWAHNGAQTVLQRTITYPKGRVVVDEIDTSYQPWQAIVLVGSGPVPTTPTPTATTPEGKRGAAGPAPVPTPTFNH